MRVNHSRNANDAIYLTAVICGIIGVSAGYLMMLVSVFAKQV